MARIAREEVEDGERQVLGSPLVREAQVSSSRFIMLSMMTGKAHVLFFHRSHDWMLPTFGLKRVTRVVAPASRASPRESYEPPRLLWARA